jgi:hypothetical protein
MFLYFKYHFFYFLKNYQPKLFLKKTKEYNHKGLYLFLLGRIFVLLS